jgi:hypothetical protein
LPFISTFSIAALLLYNGNRRIGADQKAELAAGTLLTVGQDSRVEAETIYLAGGQLDDFFWTYSNAEFASFAPFSIEKDLRHFYPPSDILVKVN